MKADYDAIRSVFKKIKSNFSGKRIGYPKIGAGLAGGDWDQISKIIDEELIDEDHTLVEFAP
jgi:O-acetyl-ADP-ribose deacetylase (regulator of RNase III)